MARGPDLDTHLANEELRPVYAVVSSESMLLDEAVSALRERAVTQAPDFNRDELRATESTGEAVVQAAGTMPMMAPRRWVHLAELHKLKAKDQAPLLAYLDNPSPTTVLCLSGAKLDKRTKLGQKLSKSGWLFELAAPRARELPGWLARRAKAHGLDITRDGAALMVDLIGGNLGELEMALQKTALYAGDGERIEVDHVEAAVAPTRIHSIFDLTGAVGDRDLGLAIALMRNALGGGESGLMVLAMIARQLRHLLQLKALGRASKGDIARALGVPPFAVDGLVRQARRYEATELQAALRAAGRADERLKSTRLDPGVVLGELLFDVIGSEEVVA